jgi:hypothetical protein
VVDARRGRSCHLADCFASADGCPLVGLGVILFVAKGQFGASRTLTGGVVCQQCSATSTPAHPVSLNGVSPDYHRMHTYNKYS